MADISLALPSDLLSTSGSLATGAAIYILAKLASIDQHLQNIEAALKPKGGANA